MQQYPASVALLGLTALWEWLRWRLRFGGALSESSFSVRLRDPEHPMITLVATTARTRRF